METKQHYNEQAFMALFIAFSAITSALLFLSIPTNEPLLRTIQLVLVTIVFVLSFLFLLLAIFFLHCAHQAR